jgi:hypothetical protein
MRGLSADLQHQRWLKLYVLEAIVRACLDEIQNHRGYSYTAARATTRQGSAGAVGVGDVRVIRIGASLLTKRGL